MSDRSQQVSALVSAMQQGQLSKADLYASLTSLKEPGTVNRPPPPPPAAETAATTNVVTDLVGAMRQGTLSKSELLSSLTSQLRERQAPSLVSRELREAEMWAELRSTTQQAPPLAEEKARIEQHRPKRVVDSSRRRQSKAQSPQVIDHEAEECTFRPKIKQLPRGLYRQKTTGTGDFLERSERWRREREIELEKKLALEAEVIISECTFQPRISENSVKSAQLSRVGDRRRADDRLYQDHKKRMAAIEAKRDIDSEREESRFQDEHPFRPTRHSVLPDGIRPRYDESTRTTSSLSRQRVHPDAPRIDGGLLPLPLPPPKECTFQPRTNQVKKNMDLAKTYLATDVFERLTARRRPASSEGGDTSPRSVASTPGPSSNNRAAWDAFLARQSAFESKKAQHVNGLKTKAIPQFTPRINKRRSHSFSAMDTGSTTSSSHTQSTFFDRLAVDARRRDSRQLIKSVKPSRDDLECTFRPAITPKAARRRESRSFDELSTGDALRRDTSRRLLKLKVEQANETTFKPRLETATHNPHSYTKHVESKLRLASAPESYLDRLKREHEKRLEHRRRLQEEIDRKQLQGATFEPQTTKCPTYIKRIARGMALAKKAAEATKPSNSEKQRPDWR